MSKANNMLKKYSIILIILLMRQQCSHGQSCPNGYVNNICWNSRIYQVHASPYDINCSCRYLKDAPKPTYGNGYILTPGVGAHKFHNQAKTWNDARLTCKAEGAHLAILNSKREAEVLQAVFQKELQNIKNQSSTDSAWLGYHNWFNENWQDWVTVLGDSLESTGFVPWHKTEGICWGPQPDHPDKQHCGALFRECGMMDDAYCTKNYAFFCEKPEKS